MKTLLKLSPFFLCLILLVGCGKVKIDWVDEETKPANGWIAQVEKELSDNSKEDCLYLYKVYAAGAKYVENNSESIGTTDQWEALLQKVHKQHHWLDSDLDSKDDDFSDALREELEERGFADPKSLNEDDTKEELVKVLNETAEGALKAYKSK